MIKSPTCLFVSYIQSSIFYFSFSILGEWIVDEIAHIDTDSGKIYFMAAKDSPTEKNLYSVGLPSKEYVQSFFQIDSVDATDATYIIQDPIRITQSPGMHTVKISSDKKWFVDCWNSIDQPPRIDLYKCSSESYFFLFSITSFSFFFSETSEDLWELYRTIYDASNFPSSESVSLPQLVPVAR